MIKFSDRMKAAGGSQAGKLESLIKSPGGGYVPMVDGAIVETRSGYFYIFIRPSATDPGGWEVLDPLGYVIRTITSTGQIMNQAGEIEALIIPVNHAHAEPIL